MLYMSSDEKKTTINLNEEQEKIVKKLEKLGTTQENTSSVTPQQPNRLVQFMQAGVALFLLATCPSTAIPAAIFFIRACIDSIEVKNICEKVIGKECYRNGSEIRIIKPEECGYGRHRYILDEGETAKCVPALQELFSEARKFTESTNFNGVKFLMLAGISVASFIMFFMWGALMYSRKEDNRILNEGTIRLTTFGKSEISKNETTVLIEDLNDRPELDKSSGSSYQV